jgi:hypothetical protein
MAARAPRLSRLVGSDRQMAETPLNWVARCPSCCELVDQRLASIPPWAESIRHDEVGFEIPSTCSCGEKVWLSHPDVWHPTFSA